MKNTTTTTTTTTQLDKTCCICLEDTQDYISCNDCNEGIYCKNCFNKIKKNDNTYTCSICRRENVNYSIILIEETRETTENIATLPTCFYIKNITNEICTFIFKALKIIIFLVIAIGIILFILFLLSL